MILVPNLRVVDLSFGTQLVLSSVVQWPEFPVLVNTPIDRLDFQQPAVQEFAAGADKGILILQKLRDRIGIIVLDRVGPQRVVESHSILKRRNHFLEEVFFLETESNLGQVQIQRVAGVEEVENLLGRSVLRNECPGSFVDFSRLVEDRKRQRLGHREYFVVIRNMCRIVSVSPRLREEEMVFKGLCAESL